MLNFSTIALILIMIGFISVTLIMVHHHKYSEMVRRKKGEFAEYTHKLNLKIDAVEREIVDLKLEIDNLTEEIDAIRGEAKP